MPPEHTPKLKPWLFYSYSQEGFKVLHALLQAQERIGFVAFAI